MSLTPIRNPLDVSRLRRFLASVPGNAVLGSAPLPSFPSVDKLEVQQFKFGQSNPTYLVFDPVTGHKFVLRRKPLPNAKLVSKLAHAVEREFYMLRGIARCNESHLKKVPVPHVYLLCEDESVVDYVFYLMEFVDGRHIINPALPGIPKDQHHRYWLLIMDTIAAIHSLDYKQLVQLLPAEHFPQFQPDKLKKGGPLYFERQIKTLTGVANLQLKTVDPIPDYNKIAQWLLKHAPPDPAQVTLIHGDFKIDNVVFAHDSPKIIAVLDWELCTFGHPIFDLANFLQPYGFPSSANQMLYRTKNADIGRDLPGVDNIVRSHLSLYHEKLGHPWNDDPSINAHNYWDAGFVFGLLRLCVISQGIAMRAAKGSASLAEAATYGGLYPALAGLALETIEPELKL